MEAATYVYFYQTKRKNIKKKKTGYPHLSSPDNAARTSNPTNANFVQSNPEGTVLSYKHMLKLEVSSYQKRGSAGG
jgi:hypothetical protein